MKKRLLLYPLYILAYGGWYLLSLLPFRMLYVLSDVLYLLAAKVLRYRHRVIWNNLTTSFPEKTEAELRDIECRFYHAFCDYLVETIKLMTMRPAQLQRRLQFKNTDDMNQRLASGQSVAVYLGHIFNWEWITSLPYWVPEGVQCCELYHPLENTLIVCSSLSVNGSTLSASPCRNRFARSLSSSATIVLLWWDTSLIRCPCGTIFITGSTSSIMIRLY